MTTLLPAPRLRSSSDHGERLAPIVTAPPGAQVNVEVEVPENTNDATFRISLKLPLAAPGRTSVVIPLAARPPKIDHAPRLLVPARKKGGEWLGAMALFMVLVGSSMLAVGLVAVLLFR